MYWFFVQVERDIQAAAQETLQSERQQLNEMTAQANMHSALAEESLQKAKKDVESERNTHQQTMRKVGGLASTFLFNYYIN